MRFLLFIFGILLLSCSKNEIVLICGDHVCINKKEASQYFEENLTIEVKIIDKKIDKSIDLVELNLKESQAGKKEITISQKKNTKKLKNLSNEEIFEIKENIRNKQKMKKMVKKESIETDKINENIKIKKKKKESVYKDNNKILKNNVNKKNEDVFDVCTILEKCSIDEISKYLLKEGIEKSFPDLTVKQ